MTITSISGFIRCKLRGSGPVTHLLYLPNINGKFVVDTPVTGAKALMVQHSLYALHIAQYNLTTEWTGRFTVHSFQPAFVQCALLTQITSTLPSSLHRPQNNQPGPKTERGPHFSSSFSVKFLGAISHEGEKTSPPLCRIHPRHNFLPSNICTTQN